MSDNANDIAIVGCALRVPGAKNVREYWKNLLGGVESIRTLTEEELIANGEDPENLRKPNYVPRAGMIDGMEMFDGEFFGFSPKECAILDPQHRHFMECAWEALEDAGHVPSNFEGRVGLFAGCGMGSYFYFNVCSHRELVDSVGLFLLRHTGNDKDFLATRVSYLLDLRGPSINVQTACSTSLVATHMACQSLLSGESDLAIAGGVTIDIPHGRGYHYREGEVMSPDGHCHAFDHRAQGTVLASGTCVVALRRLSDALADGDHIYSVIKGSAVNNDGALKVGYLAPSVDGQTAAMVEAYGVSGVDPDTIGYIECHGTGTYMGDPIEISALTQAFRASTQRKQFCRIGSVKTSIGHLDTAAGTASLIKASLAVKHGQIPASLNFEKPNPTIDFENSPFIVNNTLHQWAKGPNPRRAAINSLGVGGTNAHVVIEEPPAQPPSSPSKRKFALLTLSARNQKALDGGSQRLAAYLRDNQEVPLADVAFTLNVGRKAFDRRRVVAAASHEEAARYLEQADTRRVFTHTAVDGKASVAFMFSGGGSQYPRMCIDLYESEPQFREFVDRGLNHVQKKHGLDLRPLLFAPKENVAEASKAFEATSRQLLGIAIVEYALAKLWLSWGIEPSALIGHSLGENVAAAIAGVFQYEDLLDLVHLRGELVEKSGDGAMLSVPLPPEELSPLLGEHVDLATVNTPKLCVASGATAHIDALEKELTERGIDVRRIPIPRAGHSRMLDAILPEFRAFLRTLKLSAPTIPIVSNRTGAWLTPELARDPEHWVRHLRETVRFADGIAVLLEDQKRVLIEVGPGQTLCSLARQHPKSSQSTNIVASVRHREDEISDTQYITTALGRLWASGVDAKLERLWEGETRRRVSLPTYAWVHQRYFIDAVAPQAAGEDLTRLKRLPTVDEYGFKPVWIERPATARSSSTGETWLVFMDDAGVGTKLVKRLRAKGHTVVCVFEGDAYHKRSDTEYTLSPERGRTGYDALVRDLMASGRAPSQIVHLWLTTTVERFRPGSSFFHRNLEHGFYSLFFLAQALGDENVPRPLHITVVSTGMQQTRDEELRYPEKAAALGPIKVVPRELPGVTCSSIDLDLGGAGSAQLLQELLSTVRTGIERFASTSSNGKNGRVSALDTAAELLERDLLGEPGNLVIAHRDGRRYLQEYQRHILQPTASELPAPLRPRGVYLITGGLGGVGLTIAQMLAKRAQARLVLLNRTELPERSEWDGWLAKRGPTDRLSRLILRVRELEALGAEVMAAGADVTNLEQMRTVVEAVKARFGGVNGVFHAAGVVRDNLIQLKTELDVQDVFAPKIHGTVVLDTLLRESMGLDFTVLFSSTSALAAPPGQVDYVAANAFLDAYARAPGRAARTIAVNWGIWHGVGMAAEALSSGDESHSARMERLGAAVHPAFEQRLRDARSRSIIEGTWQASEQWFLDEHRTGAGHALIPGTGYLELARAALESNAESGAFEIRDLFFIRPLHVPDDAEKNVRVRLQRSEEGYLFDVRSRTELDGRTGWELHSQARLLMHPMQAPAPIDLAAIDARCPERRVPFTAAGIPSPQEAHLRFGPRWRVLRQVAYGQQEALATLELSPRYAGDLEHYGLHPALVDIATGYAMYLIEGYKTEEVWVPVSYGSVKVYGKLPQSIRSWVRGRPANKRDADFAVFDVTITDPQGNPLVEVKDFAIKRMGVQTDFAVASRPSRADVELEPGLGSDGDRELSPAELQLRRNYEQGIRAEEGSDALVRVLAGEQLPQVAITSLDINQLIRQASLTAQSSSAASGTKFDRPELDSAYLAPRDEIERTLVGFWEELLGVDQVGVQDSFFDLGGHSLIAVRLFAMVKKAYQVEFAISVLFEAPTIERCATLIREMIGERGDTAATGDGAAPKPAAKEASPSRSRYRHLVAMHPGEGGSRTPMFLVAGMFGNVLNLRHLAHLIGTDRPFYGVQALGLYGDEAPHETFEEMATAYIAEMRIVQPHGPYFIGGFSGGGITAFEIAHQLKAQGEEVALLVMLDSALPMEKPITPADRAKIQIQRFQRQGPSYIGTWARNRLKWEIEQLQKKLGDPEPVEHTPEQFQNDAIERAFRGALPRYRMRHLRGRIVLFRPKLEKTYVMGQGRFLTSEKRWVYEDNGWGPWCDEVEVHEVPGDHDAMVLEPNVRVLAGQLRQCIEDAERRRTIAPSDASVVSPA